MCKHLADGKSLCCSTLKSTSLELAICRVSRFRRITISWRINKQEKYAYHNRVCRINISALAWQPCSQIVIQVTFVVDVLLCMWTIFKLRLCSSNSREAKTFVWFNLCCTLISLKFWSHALSLGGQKPTPTNNQKERETRVKICWHCSMRCFIPQNLKNKPSSHISAIADSHHGSFPYSSNFASVKYYERF